MLQVQHLNISTYHLRTDTTQSIAIHSIMASEDMVFIENGPSMQLVPSSSLESLDGANAPGRKIFSHTYSPASPTISAPSLGCKPCGLTHRPKHEFACYPPIHTAPEPQDCFFGSCPQNDALAKVEDSFKMPPGLLNLPPPPIYNGPASGWSATGARVKSKKSARPPPSPPLHVSFSLL